MSSDAPAPPQAGSTRGQRQLPRRIYPYRILGMGLGGLPILLVLHQIAAPAGDYGLLAFTSLLWPHVAWLIAQRSRDPFRAELRSLAVDSALAGFWVPLMHFNALPSVLLLTVATADKISTGVRGLWLRAIPGMLMALAAAGLATGFSAQPQTTLAVLLACLPLLVIHTLAVSLGSYRLVRRVQGQNQQLEALSRVDALTGLPNRRHWQDRAESLLLANLRECQPATLLLLDIDHFKKINDQYGHMAGDDVLRGLARLIREHAGSQAQIGRLGGDEFAVALPSATIKAIATAEDLRAAAGSISSEAAPDLRCSLSIGIAAASRSTPDLRAWIDAADRALYEAKRTGRNRIHADTPDAIAGVADSTLAPCTQDM